jgi:AtzE family amidohydrolase
MNSAAHANTVAALDRIAQKNDTYNCFTQVLADAALEQASSSASTVAGPLAGLTFAVKNLFDIAGSVTIAGSKILGNARPAREDAFAVARLKAQGAVLLGSLNMDEFAYGFSTENAHYGATRNPHDLTRIAGGSSGGSAAAVASGLADITLGSDTNGSIRIPAALCGIWGLKPTYGRLSRRGTFPFVSSLDHIGPFAATLDHLALAFDALQGHDPRDPVARIVPAIDASAAIDCPAAPLRVGNLGGWFAKGLTPAVSDAMRIVAKAAGATAQVELPLAEAARSAAYVISAAEGGQLHAARLRQCPQDFDHATRDRLMAGCFVPAAAVLQAQRVRALFQQQAAALFRDFDVLIAPTTFTTAPRIGEETMEVDGKLLHIRANLGLYTQPISCIGLPVLAAPVAVTGLPIGIQIIAPAWREDLAFRLAAQLRHRGALVAGSCVVDG